MLSNDGVITLHMWLTMTINRLRSYDRTTLYKLDYYCCCLQFLWQDIINLKDMFWLCFLNDVADMSVGSIPKMMGVIRLQPLNNSH